MRKDTIKKLVKEYDIYEFGSRLQLSPKAQGFIDMTGYEWKTQEVTRHLTDKEYQEIKPYLKGAIQKRLNNKGEVNIFGIVGLIYLVLMLVVLIAIF